MQQNKIPSLCSIVYKFYYAFLPGYSGGCKMKLEAEPKIPPNPPQTGVDYASGLEWKMF